MMRRLLVSTLLAVVMLPASAQVNNEKWGLSKRFPGSRWFT
jgi:hypothetical protein